MASSPPEQDTTTRETRGSVTEVNSKRLLALNLRKLGGQELRFTPRTYILTECKDHDEFADFVSDFKASQAFAVLKRVCCAGSPAAVDVDGRSDLILPGEPLEGLHGRDAPEIAWHPGPDCSRPVGSACVCAAMAVTRRALEALSVGGCLSDTNVTDDEWELLREFSPNAGVCDMACAPQARELLEALPAECQLSLLRGNIWALKPSLNGGGNGRGIVLMDRLPQSSSDLLHWVAAVGRGGSAGIQDAKDGCVLQKLVEEPHLLDQQRLLEISMPEGSPAEGVVPRPLCGPGSFKYNLRLWILTSMSSSPSVWLYKDSYVDLAAQRFTGAMHPASQITNLLRSHREAQRYFALADFAACLRESCGGRDIYRESIWPQARAILCSVFRALQTAPTSLMEKPAARLKRLGVDLLVDAQHSVWLLEFNVLRNEYGLKAARGQDAKRRLAHRLVEEEVKLKTAIAEGLPIPQAWEDLSGFIVGGH